MGYDFDEKLLTSEKSLWDVYKLSRRLHPNNSHTIILIIVVLLLSLNSFYLDVKTDVLLKNVREWSALGFNFTITTIGFLIAGFTIFATLSKPAMMLAMMEHTNPETQLPTLKYNFFAFMKVFIAYLLAASLYLAVVLFGQADGLVSNLIALAPNSSCLKVALIKVMYVYIGTSFAYLLLSLSTFIFNIYAIVMNTLRWEYHN